MKYYLNNFLIYSIFGFIVETTLKYLFFPKLNNGSLYGPWIPIYGLGVCIIIIIMRLVFNRIKVNRLLKIALVFIISFIILSLLELIAGHILELITHKAFWNYTDKTFKIGKYICLEMSLIWGTMSLIVIYFIKPLVDKIIKKIPSSITYLVLIIFLIDSFISVFSKLN